MINFSKTFDIADESITEGFEIAAEREKADKHRLPELVKIVDGYLRIYGLWLCHQEDDRRALNIFIISSLIPILPSLNIL